MKEKRNEKNKNKKKVREKEKKKAIKHKAQASPSLTPWILQVEAGFIIQIAVSEIQDGICHSELDVAPFAIFSELMAGESPSWRVVPRRASAAASFEVVACKVCCRSLM